MAIRHRAGATAVFPPWGRRFFTRRALVVVAGVLAAGGRESVPATNDEGNLVVDDGRRVALSPGRIVSLPPSATEPLHRVRPRVGDVQRAPVAGLHGAHAADARGARP
jgi:hypothetical protein